MLQCGGIREGVLVGEKGRAEAAEETVAVSGGRYADVPTGHAETPVRRDAQMIAECNRSRMSAMDRLPKQKRRSCTMLVDKAGEDSHALSPLVTPLSEGQARSIQLKNGLSTQSWRYRLERFGR